MAMQTSLASLHHNSIFFCKKILNMETHNKNITYFVKTVSNIHNNQCVIELEINTFTDMGVPQLRHRYYILDLDILGSTELHFDEESNYRIHNLGLHNNNLYVSMSGPLSCYIHIYKNDIVDDTVTEIDLNYFKGEYKLDWSVYDNNLYIIKNKDCGASFCTHDVRIIEPNMSTTSILERLEFQSIESTKDDSIIAILKIVALKDK